MVTTLREAYEQVLMAELSSLNESMLTGEGEKRQQTVKYPPKDRVELFKVVQQYLAESKELPKFGEALNGRRDTS